MIPDWLITMDFVILGLRLMCYFKHQESIAAKSWCDIIGKWYDVIGGFSPPVFSELVLNKIKRKVSI